MSDDDRIKRKRRQETGKEESRRDRGGGRTHALAGRQTKTELQILAYSQTPHKFVSVDEAHALSSLLRRVSASSSRLAFERERDDCPRAYCSRRVEKCTRTGSLWSEERKKSEILTFQVHRVIHCR